MGTNETAPGAETTDLVITRVFDAPVERVWRAWSDPADVMGWWGPQGFTSPSAAIDFREGGTSLVCMRAPAESGGQDMYNTWTYLMIAPLEYFEYRIAFSDREGRPLDPANLGLPGDMPATMRHRVDLKDLGGGKTELTVTEYDWPVGQMLEMSRMGMEQCLDKMESVVSA